ncbi:MAG: ABC transporter ATP-binding protein [Neisseriaceae bacterium]|nr:ABC transporter ATP-binding protein [Neisseriaceae bacterium]MBQ9183082.1 ABC transporter ATP-binding protein [Neisseriaceae bacterium]MBQ9258703.1 ABC transporter ATP-binding protein [Neisseriaceae bacterium]MBQ9725678.1 ABC transporter ATP-binding protein [Neisseriaceae bacterium]MBR1819828.1 ABC transporter ATP-binding protein [Neisseriaceae bacterium]
MSWTAQHIVIKTKNKTLLDIDQITLPAQQITAIIGANGAGKSTLLKALRGLYHHISPQFQQQSVKKMTAQGKIAFVGQHEGFNTPLSLMEYVLLGRFPHLSWFAKPSAQDIENAKKILSDYEINHLSASPIQTLSGGEKQRAAVVRALMQDTALIALDEPCNHLDIRHQHTLMSDLKIRSQNNNLTAVIVLHDLNLAARYADFIVLLDHGKLVAAGVPEEVMTNETLSNAYRWEINTLHNGKHSIYFAA